MATIVVSENVTLDGVVQDPTGDDGFERGGWWSSVGDEDMQAWAELTSSEALDADALLLGRKTYEWLGARFPQRTGAWAEKLNGMPKYVVSSTLRDAAWGPTTVLRGDVALEVGRLKDEASGTIVVNASAELVPALIEHDLVDELRLNVFPTVLGDGARMFTTTSKPRTLELAESRVLGRNLVSLVYRRAR